MGEGRDGVERRAKQSHQPHQRIVASASGHRQDTVVGMKAPAPSTSDDMHNGVERKVWLSKE